MHTNKRCLSLIHYKLLMAISGLILVGFLVGHVLGNLLIFAGADAINAYAEGLRRYLPALWGMRLLLIAAAFIHIYSGIQLSILSKKASPQKYAVKKPVRSSFASRTMLFSGVFVLIFIIYHLAHLTFRTTHPEFQQLGSFDVSSMLFQSFQSPLLTLFYVLSVTFLMLHLNHGITSFFQSVGLNHPKYNHFFRLLGPIASICLAFGFTSIPLAIFFGILQ